MTLEGIALTVIAICMVLTTAGLVVVSVMLVRLIRRLEESVDMVNGQLKPAVTELRKTIMSFTETFRLLNDVVSLVKKYRKKE